MVRIAIVSLIYKSPRLADWVYQSAMEFTPMLRRGEAEFFFVANDATDECLRHIEDCGYKHIVVRNPRRSSDELFRMGYGAPEHMHRVYRAYNAGIIRSSAKILVLVNSDNYFSTDWLENLEKYSSPTAVVTSRLVEPGHPRYGVFPDAVVSDFGATPDDFDREGFLRFVEKSKLTGLVPGGAYMPCMFWRAQAMAAGLYPEGNLAGKSFEDVAAFGDVAFFERLRKAGIRHVTALDSLVYHLKEGEPDEGSSRGRHFPMPQSSLLGRAPVPGGRAEVFVGKSGSITHLETGVVSWHISRVARALQLIGSGFRARYGGIRGFGVSILRPVLPPWAFEALRASWRGARRLSRSGKAGDNSTDP